jgi:hypothetical protein
VGANDFYLLKLVSGASPSAEKEPNDDTSCADESHGADPYDSHVLHNYPGGLLPAGDVDWWQIPVESAGATVSLTCESQRLGSSLRDATFDFFPPGATEPEWSQVETATEAVQWSGTVQYQGLANIRITATQYEPGIESTLYQCDVTVRNPP